MSEHVQKSRWLVWFVTFVLIVAGGLVLIPDVYSSAASGSKPETVPMVPASFTQLAKEASPAVVNISTVKTLKKNGPVFRYFLGPHNQQNAPFNNFFNQFFGNEAPREYKEKSLGSGFIISKDGYIVTNNHVISGANEITVKLKDGNEYKAKIIGTDPSTDIALIKIKPKKDLPTLSFGNSDQLQVGQWVIAIGNPFGLQDTVTAGIISAKGRVIGEGPYDDFLQTDASINPGNSGGPLINMDDQVVGINTAIVAGGEGIGFAIPSNMAKDVIAQLKKSGKVTRGWLGIGIQNLNQDLENYYNVKEGVLVTEVFPGDPAAKAGIKANDIIVDLNGKKVTSARELSRQVADTHPGEKVEIKLIRDGKTKTVTAVLAKRNESKIAAEMGEQSTQTTNELGMEVSNITPQIQKQLKLNSTEGVVVMKIAPNSKADNAGMQKGDVILQINHKMVKSLADYNRLIDSVKSGKDLYFYIMRPYGGIKVIKIVK